MFKRHSVKFVFHEHDELIFCPILHFLALAFADNAFASPHISNLDDIYQIRIENFKESIELSWKKEMMKVPVFRRPVRRLNGMDISSNMAEQYDHFRTDLLRLGKNAGFMPPLTSYCLRRGAADVVDGWLRNFNIFSKLIVLQI